MSASKKSRSFEQGRLKGLRRMRKPLTLVVPVAAPRNFVVRAMAESGRAAGKHIRSQGAQRRSDRMALARLVAQMQNETSL